MKTIRAWRSVLWLLPLPLPLVAQAPPVISMDREPHHHLALKNEVVRIFEIDVAPRDSVLMHRHDYDGVSVVVGDATIVTTTPGQADMLAFSKAGEVSFERSGILHSMRNIGETPYRAVSIELLRNQTGARNLCGKQIPDGPRSCPAASPGDPSAPRADLPQFETDQTRVSLTRVQPHQNATFGEPGSDELLVAIDEVTVSSATKKGHDQPLHPGDFVWVKHGNATRVIKNESDLEVRIVSAAFKP